MKKLILLPTLAMFACIDGTTDKETGDSGVVDTDTEEAADPTATAGVSWGADSVTLELTVTDGLDGAEYFWGITENSGSCLTEGGCWTGEDCFAGYIQDTGNVLAYCHPITETGGNLAYGATTDGVAEGMDTVFSGDQFSSKTTNIVDDRGSAEGPCWVFGADTSYYSGYEKTCTEM